MGRRPSMIRTTTSLTRVPNVGTNVKTGTHAVSSGGDSSSSSCESRIRPWSLHHRFQRHLPHPHDHPNEVMVSSSSASSVLDGPEVDAVISLKQQKKIQSPIVDVTASLGLLDFQDASHEPIRSGLGNNNNNTPCSVSVSSSTSSMFMLLDEDNHFGEAQSLPPSSVKGGKHVRFGNCQVRSYTQVLGDHPFCSSGCPVQLGWTYLHETVMSVEKYEAEHFSCCINNPNDLRLTADERKRILCKDHPCDGEYSSGDEGGCCDSDSNNHNDCQYKSDRELTRDCRRLNRGKHNLTRKSSRQAHREFFGV